MYIPPILDTGGYLQAFALTARQELPSTFSLVFQNLSILIDKRHSCLRCRIHFRLQRTSPNNSSSSAFTIYNLNELPVRRQRMNTSIRIAFQNIVPASSSFAFVPSHSSLSEYGVGSIHGHTISVNVSLLLCFALILTVKLTVFPYSPYKKAPFWSCPPTAFQETSDEVCLYHVGSYQPTFRFKFDFPNSLCNFSLY